MEVEKARDVWSIHHAHNHSQKQKYTYDASRTAMEGIQSFRTEKVGWHVIIMVLMTVTKLSHYYVYNE